MNSYTLHPVKRFACTACSHLSAGFLSSWATPTEADKNNKETSLGRGRDALTACGERRALQRLNERDRSGQMRLGRKLVEVWKKKGGKAVQGEVTG